MKVGDLVQIKTWDVYHVDVGYDLREAVKKKLRKQTGVGLVGKLNEKEKIVYVYWSKNRPTWEHEKDLEIINESW